MNADEKKANAIKNIIANADYDKAKAKANEINAKANANVKANDIIFADMLKSLDKSLFVTNKGTNKENIYKVSLFVNLTDKEKKSLRRKIRSIRESFIYSFIRTENKESLKKLFTQFQLFCESTYNFEFSVENMKTENFCSANTSETEKQNINKAIEIIKKLF